ncbi:MAG: glucosaminidase domain-containing protein [Bacteroidaceae bacterium]|nr:glucosaminidase domain-containing protein [Bacteroidaceae bacterium]
MRRVILFILFFASVFCAYAQSGTNGYYWAYIDKYKELAMEQQKHRIPASITLAQGLLESNAGRSTLATEANNHFGIKTPGGWMGPYVVKDDDRSRIDHRRAT